MTPNSLISIASSLDIVSLLEQQKVAFMETDIDYHAVDMFQVQISSIVSMPSVGNPNMWIRQV